MITEVENPTVPLIGSQYDLRVGLGEKVSEPDIKSALETGDWGFVHSFTTGSAARTRKERGHQSIIHERNDA